MIYVKLVFFLAGVSVLGFMTNPAVGFGWLIAAWASVLFLLLGLLFIRLGRWRGLGVLVPMLVTVSLWLMIAAIRGTTVTRTQSFIAWFTENGVLKVLRFSSCVIFATIVVATIKPAELLRARLFPQRLRLFFMVFRAFVPRLAELLVSAFDQLAVLGCPRGKALAKALVLSSTPFPTHQRFVMAGRERLRFFLFSLVAVLCYWMERIMTIEIPEMSANMERASSVL